MTPSEPGMPPAATTAPPASASMAAIEMVKSSLRDRDMSVPLPQRVRGVPRTEYGVRDLAPSCRSAGSRPRSIALQAATLLLRPRIRIRRKPLPHELGQPCQVAEGMPLAGVRVLQTETPG